MCDRIVMIDNAIRTTESDMHDLKKMLKACEKNREKKYPCELISEQIHKKERDIEVFQEMREKNVALCNLYKELNNVNGYKK